MKTRKIFGIIGIILSVLALLGVTFFSGRCGFSLLWGLIPVATFVASVLLRYVKPNGNKKWLKVVVCILAVLAFVATVIIGIFYHWFCLLPLVVLLGLLIWLNYLGKKKEALYWTFGIAIVLLAVIGIILWGVSTIVNNIDNVHINQAIIDKVIANEVEATEIAATEAIVDDMTINNDVVINQGDINVEQGDVNVEQGDINVEQGDVNVEQGDVNVGGDINEDAQPTEPPATTTPPTTTPPTTTPPTTTPPTTTPPATEPPATEPPATEPPATEPPATEPPATNLVPSLTVSTDYMVKGDTVIVTLKNAKASDVVIRYVDPNTGNWVNGGASLKSIGNNQYRLNVADALWQMSVDLVIFLKGSANYHMVTLEPCFE